MKRRQIALVTGLVLLAFGLGVWLGSRVRTATRRPEISVITTTPPADERVPDALNASSAPPCADVRNAGQMVGKRGCVTGLVLRAFSARSGNTFLDFCQDYRNCPFTSVIFAADKDKFGDLGSLQGKRVEIRGDVVSYQDRAEIIVHDPQQVRSAP